MNRQAVLYTLLLSLGLTGSAVAQPTEDPKAASNAIDEPGVADQAAADLDEPAEAKREAGTGLRLKPNAKWHILGHSLGLPLYFVVQTSLHESSHALAGTAAGGTVTDFRPYPHMEDQNFVFGSTNIEGKFSDAQVGLILAAPVMTDVLMFTASDLLLTYAIDDDSAVAPFVLVGGMVAPLVDFLWNVNGTSQYNDTTRWTKLAGLPRWSTMLMGDALAAVAVWRILHHGYYILFEHDRPASVAQPTLTVSPTFVAGGGALTISGRF